MNLEEFQQKINTSPLPLVVDLWAPWCAPCRMIRPVLEKLAEEYQERVEFVAVNADESQEVLQSLGVMGIPTVLAYAGGKEFARVTGARREVDYRQVFEALAQGKEVKISMTPFDRALRLGAGVLLAGAGFFTHSWILLLAGGVVAFLGVYDRCPVWKALTSAFKRA